MCRTPNIPYNSIITSSPQPEPVWGLLGFRVLQSSDIGLRDYVHTKNAYTPTQIHYCPKLYMCSYEYYCRTIVVKFLSVITLIVGC